MQKLTRLCLALILLFCSCSKQEIYTERTEDHVLIPSTHVFLQVFDGFKRAETFRGIKSERGDVTIKVQETDTPFEVVIKDYTPAKLIPKKMTLVSKEKIVHNDQPAIMYEFLQERGNSEFTKFNLVQKIDDNRTIIVRGSFLNSESYRQNFGESVYNTVISAYYEHDEDIIEKYSKTYKLDPSLTSLLPVQDSNFGSYYTLDGQYPTKHPSNTTFHLITGLLGPSYSATGRLTKEELAIKQIKQLMKTEDIEIISSGKKYFDGLQGWEVVAHEKEKGKLKRLAYLAVIYKDYSGYRVYASSEEEFEERLSDFQLLARSFELQ